MHLLLVNLYEFGLFLRILLWISIPLIVVTLLVTTWLHYRSRRRAGNELRLSMEGMDISATPEEILAAIQGRRRTEGEEIEGAAGYEGAALGAGDLVGEGGDSNVVEEPTESERNRMYKGILWMKEKYEQYRELADQRIEHLKDELARSEQRYQDLVDKRVEERAPDTERLLEEKGRQLEEKDHLLESKNRQIEDLQSQLQIQWRQTEELVVKLQNSSQLLLKISQELDGSLPPATQPQADDQARF